MKTISHLLALASMLCMAQSAFATIPAAINYQGRITNAAGVPQPGIKTMSLKIHDAPTDGIVPYSEPVGNVTVDANESPQAYFAVAAGFPVSAVKAALAISPAPSVLGWTRSGRHLGLSARAACMSMTPSFISAASASMLGRLLSGTGLRRRGSWQKGEKAR